MTLDRLLLKVTPQRDDPHGHRRLRRLLKYALRALGVRCIEVRPVEGADRDDCGPDAVKANG